MKAIIPVKSNSERVKNKNFRRFYNDLSLLDILIIKLTRVMDSKDIYVSCDDISAKMICDKYNVNYIERDKSLIDNDVPMSKVITEVVRSVPGEDDIVWCLVTDPLFDSYAECFDIWNNLDKEEYDSLCVVYNFREYILDENFEPIGFGFGKDHIPTQMLKNKYLLNNTAFFIKRQAVYDNEYYIGKKTYWYVANNISVDIDTEKEFKLAQVLYSEVFC